MKITFDEDEIRGALKNEEQLKILYEKLLLLIADYVEYHSAIRRCDPGEAQDRVEAWLRIEDGTILVRLRANENADVLRGALKSPCPGMALKSYVRTHCLSTVAQLATRDCVRRRLARGRLRDRDTESDVDEAGELVEHLLARLPASLRRVVVARYLSPAVHSQERAGRELGYTRDQIQTLLYRARDLLKETAIREELTCPV